MENKGPSSSKKTATSSAPAADDGKMQDVVDENDERTLEDLNVTLKQFQHCLADKYGKPMRFLGWMKSFSLMIATIRLNKILEKSGEPYVTSKFVWKQLNKIFNADEIHALVLGLEHQEVKDFELPPSMLREAKDRKKNNQQQQGNENNGGPIPPKKRSRLA